MDVAKLRHIFSTRIRKLREGKMNQGEFADSVGISRGAMSYYEQKLRTPDIGVLRQICEKHNISADYLLGLIPDTNHAVSDVCRETGLYPKSAQRLRILQQLKELKFDSFETVIEHFIDDDPKEALQMAAHTAATPMVNLLLITDEGLNLLTLLSAIIFGAELVTAESDKPQKPQLKLMTNHQNIEAVFPLQNITAALWVNVQEEVAQLRDKLEGKNIENDESE
jgi:transcriptional regulator with XRE-family HTH domain